MSTRGSAPVDGRYRSAWDRPPRDRSQRAVAGPRIGAAAVVVALALGTLVLGGTTGAVRVPGLTTAADVDVACTPTTLYGVTGSAPGSAEALRAITDPLAAEAGDGLTVVTVPPPADGGSYAATETAAVSALARTVADRLAACPTGAVMLFGHSGGAQVAGDLASRVGTGQEAGVPARRVVAVGLLGDPSRGTGTRTVPDGVTGQGILPARAAGFGALDARTIEICAPRDPVCDSLPRRPAQGLAAASADPVHSSYPALTVVPGTTVGRWAADSLGRLIDAATVASTPPASSATTSPTSPPAVGDGPDPSSAGSTTAGPTTTAGPAAPNLTTASPATTSPATTSPTTAGGGTGTPPTASAAADPDGQVGAGPSTSPSTADREASRPATTGRSADATWALSSGLEGFKSTPWNNQGATDPQAAPSPDVPGRTAVKFTMPAGGKRTEAEPDVAEFPEGRTAFVGYRGFFAPGFPVDTDAWQLIMQFKQPGEGSPPLAVEVGKGQLRLANNGGNQKDFCPVGVGAFSFRLRITFGGTIDAWCGDRQTLRDYRTPEPNVNGSAYLKTGIYRDSSIGRPGTLFLDDLLIGDTEASVSGLAGGAGRSTGTPGPIAAGTTPAGTTPAGTTPAGTTSTTTSTAGSRSPTPGAPSTASSASGAGGRRICEKFGSTPIAEGRFLVQNNEWGADDGQCITSTAAGFRVDAGAHAKSDGPAAYPSIMSGCWMGTCTTGTTLPRRISELGPITSSIAATVPAGTRTNLAYDVWVDSTPKRTGQNDALELMIWLDATDGVRPIGAPHGSVELAGARWEVWSGDNGGVPVLSYVRQGAVTSADDVPITGFLRDAVGRGAVDGTAFLTNIQAGFEPWTGGPGLRVDRFDVRYGPGGE